MTGAPTDELFQAEKAFFGKAIVESGGEPHPDSQYGFIMASPGFPADPQEIRAKLIGDDPLSSKDILDGVKRMGALVFKTFEGGLAVGRVRTRAEAGEGLESRHFEIGQYLFLPGVTTWSEMPVGFFRWCWTHLTVEPPIYTATLKETGFQIATSADDLNYSKEGAALVGVPQARLVKFYAAIEEAVTSTQGGAHRIPFSVQPTVRSGYSENEMIWALDVAILVARELAYAPIASAPVDVTIGLAPKRVSSGVLATDGVSLDEVEDTVSDERQLRLRRLQRQEPKPEPKRDTTWPKDPHGRDLGIAPIVLDLD